MIFKTKFAGHLSAMAAAAFLLCAGSAHAAPIFYDGFDPSDGDVTLAPGAFTAGSFSDNAANWTVIGLGASGVFNPAGTGLFNVSVPSPPNVLYINSLSTVHGGPITPLLSTPGSTYTLSFYYGNRLDNFGSASGSLPVFTAILLDGLIPVATDVITTLPSPGTFNTASISWTDPTGLFALNGPLSVEFINGSLPNFLNGGSFPQFDIDDVTISASAGPGGGGAPVPEPGTWMLLGMGLLGFAVFTRRRLPGHSNMAAAA